MFEKIKAIIFISRPINLIITFLSVIVAAILCIESQTYSELKIILAAISAAFVGAAGNVYNDIRDIEIDKVNRPNRVLPKGLISVNNAQNIYLTFVALSFFISSFINLSALIVVVSATIVIFIYSYKFKQIPLLGNFVVALTVGFAFIYGGIAVDNWDGAIFPALFAFFINLIRELVKDIEDTEGDKQNNVITYPSRFGIKKTNRLILILTMVFIVVIIIPIYLKVYTQIFAFIIFFLVIPLLIYFVISIHSNSTKKNISKLSLVLKLNMIIGLAAIYWGR